MGAPGRSFVLREIEGRTDGERAEAQDASVLDMQQKFR